MYIMSITITARFTVQETLIPQFGLVYCPELQLNVSVFLFYLLGEQSTYDLLPKISSGHRLCVRHLALASSKIQSIKCWLSL